MRFVYLADLDAHLRYHDLPGKGPARIYLPGLGGASSAGFPGLLVQPALAGHRSLLVDPLGFGFSDRPEAFGYTLEDHARTVAALLDHVGLAACAVVGHSWGGSVAITLAALRPDLVSRLVLAEANLDPGGGALSSPIAAQTEDDFLHGGYQDLLSYLRREVPGYAGDLQVADPRALHRSAVSLVVGTQPTLRERFLSSPIPRAYIIGEESLKDAYMAKQAEDLPKHGVGVLVVPNVGHGMGIDDNPASFADVLRNALGDEA
jgi:pimeloyl-ACP methyl ester carboxylesterase